MRDVAVIGVGMTKFGELWEQSLRDLITEAGMKAIADANLSGSDIDGAYVGTMSAGKFVGQEHIAPLVVDMAGLSNTHIPAVRVEAGDASGSVAFREAYLAVASGAHELVIAGGVEKMTDVSSSQMVNIQSTSCDQEWEAFFGASMSSLYGMMARAHMHRYGTTREQLAAVAVKNHANGVLNPNARFKFPIKPEDVLKAGMVADPLTTYDCAPASDGAAAVILCSMERARKFTDKPIRIAASVQASDTIALHDRRDICTMDSVVLAAKKAYAQAGITAEKVNLAEVHDAYTIGEIMAIEDLGFAEKGKGGIAAASGETALTGRIPINTSGGMKARGHPLGATGIAQIIEIVDQLKGRAGGRQVKDAKFGLAQSVGGTGATAVVNILEGGL
ncbi:MAG: thiolase domain-containing protein [Candidatus Thermoplasmatota archaeon]|nr:thiolase domain-containing protein [Candidatus Thermoplasmatota archaeon]